MIITSLQNPKVKSARELRERKAREDRGLALLEGYRAVRRAFDCGIVLTEVFYAPELFLGKNEDSLLGQISVSNAALHEVAGHVLAKMAYRDRPEGIIAVAKTKKHLLSDMPSTGNGLYVLVESIEKPGNLGSILRSADAAGADGVIVCDKRTDIYNPNVITASTGALFSMPLAECSAAEALDWLKGNDIMIVAATPEATDVYTDVDMTRGIAIVAGSEQYGLSDYWKNKSDSKVKIPMRGYIDSLNVAVACTVLLFEAARQREESGRLKR